MPPKRTINPHTTMTPEEMYEYAESDEVQDEFLKFERVEPKRSPRRDLHAMLLMDELVPGSQPIVSCAEHDQIWFACDIDMLAVSITKAHILELTRCGIMFDQETDSLSRFT